MTDGAQSSGQQRPDGLPRGRPFQPGQSGNPGGRPKSDRSWLVEKFGEDGRKLYERLDRLRNGKRTPAKLKADIDMFFAERLHGKARQALDIDAHVSASTTVTHRHEPAAGSGPCGS